MEHLRMVWMLALVPRSFTMWFMDILVTKACRHNYQNYMINILHVLMSCGKVIFVCDDKCLVQYYDWLQNTGGEYDVRKRTNSLSSFTQVTFSGMAIWSFLANITCAPVVFFRHCIFSNRITFRILLIVCNNVLLLTVAQLWVTHFLFFNLVLEEIIHNEYIEMVYILAKFEALLQSPLKL